MNKFNKLPVIPKDEYPKRWIRIQQMMEQGLDILFACANNSRCICQYLLDV